MGSNPIGSTKFLMAQRLRLLLLTGALLLVVSPLTTANAQTRVRTVHVFVALADNQHQGIVPVPARLGNGSDPDHNLYWGAAFGVKSYFKASGYWNLLWCGRGENSVVLERCVFKHKSSGDYLVADAYEGSAIRQAVTDFLSASAGTNAESLSVKGGTAENSIAIGGSADLVVYVGHDAFMDFQIQSVPRRKENTAKPAIVLACASKPYFGPYLNQAGAFPLLWTTGLMAPEAYTLKAALDGWLLGENGTAIRTRAAQAYDRYQHCGLRSAQRLFATGW